MVFLGRGKLDSFWTATATATATQNRDSSTLRLEKWTATATATKTATVLEPRSGVWSDRRKKYDYHIQSGKIGDEK